MIIEKFRYILYRFFWTGETYESRHCDSLNCPVFAGNRFATSLRLSNDIDLLVLDGKKVSSSLLRGAESIELENGRHQLVFRVENHSPVQPRRTSVYFAPAGHQL